MQMYFIALVLPEELNKKVVEYKNFMLEKFHCKVGLKSPAHITIVPPFWMEEEKEKALLHDIETISTGLIHFPVATNNFAAFRPRTIFIGVQPNEYLDQLKKVSDDFFEQKQEYQLKIDRRPFHPHITIATRDLFKKAFHEAWPLFEHKKFEEEWTATGLSILRHNKKNWDVICTSQFKNAL